MVILVCGSRYWKDLQTIMKVLESYANEKPLVIDGAAPGADSLGHEAAKYLGLSTKRFPANWVKYGRSAGPIRNRQMLNEGKPDLVLAFHENIGKSKGTKDMVAIAKKAGVPVKLIADSGRGTE